MVRKIFVSYKYKDEKVKDLQAFYHEEIDGNMIYNTRKTRVRDYVNKLQDMIGSDHMNLGEKDGESLADFSDKEIETDLKRKIKQSSLTVVLISKGMGITGTSEREQWVPWEISYSLRTVPTGGNTKQMNAVLGVVLPDESGTYDWYYTYNQNCNSLTHHTNKIFNILRRNMFNLIQKETRECNGSTIHISTEPSFIKTVKWTDFMHVDNFNLFIEKAIEIKDSKESYDYKINLE